GPTGTMLNWPATGDASEPVARSVPGWFVPLFEYRPTTRLVAVEPVSTNTRMFDTVPVEAVVVLNASATPAVFESSFGCTDWLPNTNVFDAGGAAPVPVSGMLCGLPVALSAMRSDALRAPVADGVNVTFTAQLPPAAIEPARHVLELTAKSPGF